MRLARVETYQKSLRIREEIGDKEGIGLTLGKIGGVHYSQGNYTLAREDFADAISTVEELRGRVAGDEQQQQQFFQTQISPYHGMIRLLVDERKPVEAFGYAERVKGRALLDTLQIGRVDVTKATTENDQAEERRLNSEIVSLNTQIYRENLRKQPDKAVLIDLEARRTRARTNYEAFQINLYAAHPELKIQRGEMKPISIDEAGKLIPSAGTAILEYVVTEDKTYLFVLTKGQQSRASRETSAAVPILKVYTIDIKRKDLADRVNRFYGRVTQKDIDFPKFARELYDLLIDSSDPAHFKVSDPPTGLVVGTGRTFQVVFQAGTTPGNRYADIVVTGISPLPGTVMAKAKVSGSTAATAPNISCAGSCMQAAFLGSADGDAGEVKIFSMTTALCRKLNRESNTYRQRRETKEFRIRTYHRSPFLQTTKCISTH